MHVHIHVGPDPWLHQRSTSREIWLSWLWWTTTQPAARALPRKLSSTPRRRHTRNRTPRMSYRQSSVHGTYYVDNERHVRHSDSKITPCLFLFPPRFPPSLHACNLQYIHPNQGTVGRTNRPTHMKLAASTIFLEAKKTQTCLRSGGEGDTRAGNTRAAALWRGPGVGCWVSCTRTLPYFAAEAGGSLGQLSAWQVEEGRRWWKDFVWAWKRAKWARVGFGCGLVWIEASGTVER